VAFTDESRVTAQNQVALQRFCKRHLPYLDVLFLPTWYDGDKDITICDSSAHLSKPWDSFNPKEAYQLEDVHTHNATAIPAGREFAELDEGRMPKVVEMNGSLVLVVKLRKPLDSHKNPDKEVKVFMNSNAPASMCRALVKDSKVRRVVSLINDNFSGTNRSPVPIAPIFWGLFGRNKLQHLQQIDFTRTDLGGYEDRLIINDSQDVLSNFHVATIES
jgi:hypothetical protein